MCGTGTAVDQVRFTGQKRNIRATQNVKKHAPPDQKTIAIWGAFIAQMNVENTTNAKEEYK